MKNKMMGMKTADTILGMKTAISIISGIDKVEERILNSKESYLNTQSQRRKKIMKRNEESLQN